MKNIKTLIAALAACVTINAADTNDCYGTFTKATAPNNFTIVPARAFATATSSGVQLDSQPSSQYVTWAARYRITGNTNGVAVNFVGTATVSHASWMWGDQQWGPAVLAPWAVICNKPANWLRLEVWYFDPAVTQNGTNYIVYTRSDVWGREK